MNDATRRGLAELSLSFERRYGATPLLFRAPGRVNLIGEHTDYNDGFVLPAALDLATFVAIAPRTDRLIKVHSANLDRSFTFDLDVAQERRRDWSDYVRGVAVELGATGHRLPGADIAIWSTLPMGSGLSASAALEVAVGYALMSVAGEPIDRLELAKASQSAENAFVGMRCGIMDQYISCHGIEGCALLLDCRSLEATPIRIDSRARIVVANTMVHHQLAGSAYNERRLDCEQAVAILYKAIDGVAALRDIDTAQLEMHAHLLPGRIARRARHVVTENARTLEMAAALEAGALETSGRLMNASHASLRDDYEVSCPELDLMVDLARGAPGAYGARMTGGGFGGCVVSLVEATAAESFAARVAPAYEKETGLAPVIFSCFPAAGAGSVAI
ncbi:MAG: galactokinase [Methylocystis sp.]|nr:MAG: galactokinase [Methylocystis sp.]